MLTTHIESETARLEHETAILHVLNGRLQEMVERTRADVAADQLEINRLAFELWFNDKYKHMPERAGDRYTPFWVNMRFEGWMGYQEFMHTVDSAKIEAAANDERSQI